jgi:hypothetical protein
MEILTFFSRKFFSFLAIYFWAILERMAFDLPLIAYEPLCYIFLGSMKLSLAPASKSFKPLFLAEIKRLLF